MQRLFCRHIRTTVHITLSHHTSHHIYTAIQKYEKVTKYLNKCVDINDVKFP